MKMTNKTKNAEDERTRDTLLKTKTKEYRRERAPPKESDHPTDPQVDHPEIAPSSQPRHDLKKRQAELGSHFTAKKKECR
jgi:hypothetical protein